MRLLNVHTLQLEEFIGEFDIPEYGILSHTWENEEILFSHINNLSDDIRARQGFQKVKGACILAEEEGLDYIWIDTLCIDKSSSADLSEAINSMFNYYRNAFACYVYLSDYSRENEENQRSSNWSDRLGSSFKVARWFTRGWTLQELIAPQSVFFYDKKWEYIASRRDIAQEISTITRIDKRVLLGQSHLEYSLVERMSWAAYRYTTRVEDMAYSLLGIFDVHMPMLYGEGMRAFIRLQDEILKTHHDITLYLWQGGAETKTVLAPHVMAFRDIPPWISDMKKLNSTHLILQHPEIFEDPEEYYILNPPPVLTARGIYTKAVIVRLDENNALMFTYRVYKRDLVLLHLEKYTRWDFFERGSHAIRLMSPEVLTQNNLRFKKASIYLKARERDSIHWYRFRDPSAPLADHQQFNLIHVLYAPENGQLELKLRTSANEAPPIVGIFEISGCYVVLGLFSDFVPWTLPICANRYESSTKLFNHVNSQVKVHSTSNAVFDLKRCSTECKHSELPLTEVKRRPGRWFTPANTPLIPRETFFGPGKVFYTLNVSFNGAKSASSLVKCIGEWQHKSNQIVRPHQSSDLDHVDKHRFLAYRKRCPSEKEEDDDCDVE
jgi:heterokaryon incompatibility protein (HET)